jgi:hypothetical protein
MQRSLFHPPAGFPADLRRAVEHPHFREKVGALWLIDRLAPVLRGDGRRVRVVDALPVFCAGGYSHPEREALEGLAGVVAWDFIEERRGMVVDGVPVPTREAVERWGREVSVKIETGLSMMAKNPHSWIDCDSENARKAWQMDLAGMEEEDGVNDEVRSLLERVKVPVVLAMARMIRAASCHLRGSDVSAGPDAVLTALRVFFPVPVNHNHRRALRMLSGWIEDDPFNALKSRPLGVELPTLKEITACMDAERVAFKAALLRGAKFIRRGKYE